MGKRNHPNSSYGSASSGTLARPHNVTFLVSDLWHFGLIDADINDPVARSRVIGVEFVVFGDVLLFDEDFFANFHGVEKRLWDCGWKRLSGNA